MPYQMKNGKWRAQRQIEGKRLTRVCETRREALDWESAAKSLLLSGCAVTSTHKSGNERLALLTSDEVSQWIVRGETTTQDVLDWLGPPSSKAVSSTDAGDFEVWTYTFTVSTASTQMYTYRTTTNAATTTLTVNFGADGTASSYTFNSGGTAGAMQIR